MFGMMLLGLIWSGGPGSANLLFTPVAVIFSIGPAIVCAALSALLGPWLRRYHPLIQSILFGLIGVGAVAVLLIIIDVIESLRSPCPSTLSCVEPFTGPLLVLYLAGVPLFILAAVWLGVAIFLSHRPSVARLALTLGSVILVAFVATQVLGALPPSSSALHWPDVEHRALS